MPEALTVAVTKPEAGDGEALLDQVEVVHVARTRPAPQGVPGILEPLLQPGGVFVAEYQAARVERVRPSS